jgi:hypothetical protein
VRDRERQRRVGPGTYPEPLGGAAREPDPSGIDDYELGPAADRTLGGLCDWVEAEAPRPVDLVVDGAAALKAAVIPIVLH